MRKILLASAVAGVALAVLFVQFRTVTKVEDQTKKPAKAEVGATVSKTCGPFNVVGGKPGLPLPALPTSPEGLVKDPADPAYDPTLLLPAGYQSHDLFNAEPRVAAWATPMEKHISERMTADFETLFGKDSGVQLMRTQCRTSTCAFEIESPEKLENQASQAAQLFMPGEMVSLVDLKTEDGRTRQSFIVLVSKENRDKANYDKWYATMRRETLEEVNENPVFDPPLPLPHQ